MIQEAYCSFEVSILLKKKGFEGDINAYYHIWDSGDKVCSVQEFRSSEAPHLYIPAPTLQTAMKWLREKYRLHIDIDPSEGNWNPTVITLEDWSCAVKYGDNIPIQDTYEEAVEAALKYVLENLI